MPAHAPPSGRRSLLWIPLLAFAAAYCAAVAVFNAPRSPARAALLPAADRAFSPAFSQTWKLFASPIKSSWSGSVTVRGPAGESAEGDLSERLEHPLPARLFSHSKTWQLGKCYVLHALAAKSGEPPRDTDLSRRIARSSCRDELLTTPSLRGLQPFYDRLFTALARERFPGRSLTHFRVRLYETRVQPLDAAERTRVRRLAVDSGWRPIVPGVAQ